MKNALGLAEAAFAVVLALVFFSSVQLDAGLEAPLEVALTTQPSLCYRPLNLWFCVAVLQVAGFAAAFIVGHWAEDRAGWWCVDPRSQVAKCAFMCTWAMFLPLLASWTAIGMSWLSETLHKTPECFSDNRHLTLLAVSQILCGIAIAAYVVFVVCVWDAQRCRRKNAVAIELVQDADLVHRWGPLKVAANMELCGGLSHQEFFDLPLHRQSCDEGQCVVCLADMIEGDHARSLPSCGHSFHRACIDLWLLRKTTCPLCKADVRQCQTMRQQHVT